MTLRFVLIVPFIVLIALTVGITSYWSLQSGQQAVQEVAGQLRREITSRIKQHLDSYLVTPQLINQLNLDAIQQGRLDIHQFSDLERYFWQQIQRFESVGFIFFANEAGEIIGVERLEDGSLVTLVVEAHDPGNFRFYHLDDQGQRTELWQSVSDFDPRQRPWYHAAQQMEQPTWGQIFNYVGEPRMAISAVMPLFDESGQLVGVLGSDLLLTFISDYLHTLQIGQSGQTFIIERSGLLVASSQLDHPFQTEGSHPVRLPATQSPNPLEQATAQFLATTVQDWHDITTSQQFDLQYQKDWYFVQVTPFWDQYGLDWLIVVIIPEADFLSRINHQRGTTIELTVLALLMAIILGVFIVRWIAQPILSLNQAAKALATGQWDEAQVAWPHLSFSRTDEVGQLAISFQQMADRLRESFSKLEARNMEMAALNETLSKSEKLLHAVINTTPDLIFVKDRQFRWLLANNSVAKIFEATPAEMIGRTDVELGVPPQIVFGDEQHTKPTIRSDDEAVLNGEIIRRPQVKLSVAGQGKRVFDVHKIPLRTANGEIYAVLGVARDVTERVKVEEQLRQQRDELEAAVTARMASLVRVNGELQRRIDQLATLNHITQTVATMNRLRTALEVVAQAIGHLFDADGVTISLLDAGGTLQEIVAIYSAYPDKPALMGGTIDWSKAIRDLNLTKSTIIPQAQTNPLTESFQEIIREQRIQCLLIVPLQTQGRTIGTINITTDQANREFTVTEVKLAETIAGQIAGAIETTRLFKEEQRQRQMADSLREVATVLNSSLNQQTVLNEIIKQLGHVIRLDSAGVLLKEGQRLIVSAGTHFDSLNNNAIAITSQEPVARVFNTQQPEIVADVLADPYWQSWENSPPIRSWMGAPLLINHQAIGVLTADSFDVATYTPEDAQILQAFATQAATAIRNARLYQEVRREKQLFETLFVNSPVATVIINLKDYTVTSWNPAAERLFGYSKEAALGHNIDDLITSPNRREEALTYGHELEQTHSVRAIVQRSRQDGSLVDVELLAVSMNLDGEQRAGLILYHDITELEQARRTAEAANRAKSEFLSNMSHELRTPLNGILGYAQILKRDKHLTPRQAEGLAIIHHSGEHLLTLINDILDLSKIEANRMDLYPTETDLLQFLQNLVNLTRMRAEHQNVLFNYYPLTNLPGIVLADEKRLRQVLLNLLGNAIKFTEGGEVSLRVSAIFQDEETTPETPPIVDICFEVEDTGVGMTPEQLVKIFRPFEQVGDLQSRADGTGLGLAISRRLVELMGSQLQVESEPNRGSKFWFIVSLPVLSAETVATPMIKQEIIGYIGPRRKILVVDDELYNRAVLIDMLTPLGFEVAEAADAQQCFQLASVFQPDMIFMDLIMPGMGGLEATIQLRQQEGLEDVPIIAVSASASEMEQKRSLTVGCNDFLAKPFRVNDLLAILGQYLTITWQYGDIIPENVVHSSDELIPPPADELAELYVFARMGNVRKIREWADYVEQLDERYAPFADRFRQLAKGFHDREILELIEQYIH